jgi:parvulin-like peptidyl-prolyl isomerase
MAPPPALRARSLLPALIALGAIGLAGCGSLATSPAWIGGGMEVVAPLRVAAEDARAEREREIIARQPNKISARHILVMHGQSKSKPESVTRSRDEARARAQQVLIKIRGGADFDQMVKEYTDEPGGAERSGDLGAFDRAQMVKGFSDAAFALKVGEVSEVIETPFGFHIIKRTELAIDEPGALP